MRPPHLVIHPSPLIDSIPPANTQATGYWHWFFLIQPSPQVEDFILTDPKKYWAMLSSRGSHTGVKWSEEDVGMYQEGYFTKEGIHAVCLPSSFYAHSHLLSRYVALA
jgi:hypothetical protein